MLTHRLVTWPMALWGLLLLWPMSCTDPANPAGETVATPVIAPAAGEISPATSVTLSCATAGASIYYTINGATPDAVDGILYESGFSLAAGTVTVQAVAVRSGMTDSAPASRTYAVLPLAGSTTRLEAEAATLVPANDASGGPAVNGTWVSFQSGGSLEFDVSGLAAGRYSLKVCTRVPAAMGSAKTNTLVLNGVEYSFADQADGTWQEHGLGTVSLDGSDSLALVPAWGWFDVDWVEFGPPEDTTAWLAVSAGLSNPNAGQAARRLMKYLADSYGTRVIAGQMDLTWDDSVDMAGRVHADTGKYPALMGFDFMNLGMTGTSGLNQVAEALAWWNGSHANTGTHGIVAFCWHWRDPSGLTDNFYVGKADAGNNTAFRIPYNVDTGSWNTGSQDYAALMADLDRVASQLQTLEDAGVPVLWRPLHEASGGWFWWGASGAEAHVALWRLMYDYFTSTKGLDNLIWVWNGQADDWYPGDAWVDIVGEDVYATPGDFSSQSARWTAGVKCADDYATAPKLVALSETGTIPDPDQIAADGAWWSWFMTWNDGSAGAGVTDAGNYWSGDYYNPAAHKLAVYTHALVTTLDELPDLDNYPLE